MCAALLSSLVKFPRSFCFSNLTSFLKSDALSSRVSLKLSFLRCDCRSVNDYRRKIAEPVVDAVQPYVCFKFLRLIKGAIRELGPIPEENEKLASILKKAEECNVPVDFVDFASRVALDTRAKTGIFEMLYLNHGYFVLQYEELDTSSIKHHILKICNRYDAFLVTGPGKWNQYFNPEGILSVQEQKSQPIADKKEAEQIAFKVGALSVKKEINLKDWTYWQFHCEPGDLHKVKKALQKENYQVDEAFVGFIPKREVSLPEQVKRRTHSIISELNKIPAVDNVYHNIKL